MIPISSSLPEGIDHPAIGLVGLTGKEAEERLSQYGPNDPTPVRRGALAYELLILFLNPLVIILLVASIASAILNQPVDAGITFLWLCLV